MESMSRGSCQGVLLMLTVSETWRGISRKARRQTGYFHTLLFGAFGCFLPDFPAVGLVFTVIITVMTKGCVAPGLHST